MGCADLVLVVTGVLGGLVETGDYYFNRELYGPASRAYAAARFEDRTLGWSPEFFLRLGMVDFYSGEHRKAAAHFNNALYLATDGRMKAGALTWLGRSLFAQGDYAAANRYFSQVVTDEPRLPLEFLYYFGLTLYKQGRVGDAFNLLQNLYEQAGDEYDRRELGYLLGLCLVKTEQYGAARFYLEEIEPEPGVDWFGGDAVYLRALCAYHLGEKRSAADLAATMGGVEDSRLRGRAAVLLGTILIEEQRYDEAVAALTPAAEDSSLVDDVRFRVGYAYFQQGAYRKAVEYFDGLRQSRPELAARALFLGGDAYAGLGKGAEAAERYKELVDRFPGTEYREAGQFRLAQVHFDAGDYSRAQTEFRNFLTLFPESGQQAQAEYRLALCLERLARYDEALEWLARLEDHAPPDLLDGVRYVAGSILLTLGRFEEARSKFELVSDPARTPSALKGIGDALFGQSEYRAAVNAYRRALDANPDQALADDIRFQVERGYWKLGVYGSETEMFRSYVRKYPSSAKSPGLQFEIGVRFYQGQKYAQAIAEFERLAAHYVRSDLAAEGLELAAKSYWKLNQVDGAIATYRRVLDSYATSPTVPRVLEELGRLYASLERFDDALQTYAQLVREYPTRDPVGPVLLEMGRLYRHLGKWHEAKTVLVRLINQFPRTELRREARLEMVRVYKGESSWRSAERAVGEFLETYGPTGDGFWEWAEIKRAQAEYRVAQELFVKASEHYGANRDRSAQALFEAGLCALKTGRQEEAKELFVRVEILAVDERLRIEAKRRIAGLEP